MKASQFDYIRAQTIKHALQLLSSAGDDARVIAGGQSLVPMMAMRLATPGLLIDINQLDELKTFNVGAESVTTGATLTQKTLHDDARLNEVLPLVAQAMPWVGHQQTRNRGTVGGSLTQADPSAELPLVACVLNARMHAQEANGDTKQLDAAQFYTGSLTTQLNDTDLLTHIEWPVWPTSAGRIGAAFDEVAIRHGDFAMASAACQIQLDSNGSITRAAVGVGGVAAVPLALPELATLLVGQVLNDQVIDEISQRATVLCDPGSDIHASAQYRRHLAGVLMRRVITQAHQRASNTNQVVAP